MINWSRISEATQLGQCRAALNDPKKVEWVNTVLNQVVDAVIRTRWEHQDWCGPYQFPAWIKTSGISLDSVMSKGMTDSLAESIKKKIESNATKGTKVLLSKDDVVHIFGTGLQPTEPVQVGLAAGRPTFKEPFVRFKAKGNVKILPLHIHCFHSGTEFALDRQGRWIFLSPLTRVGRCEVDQGGPP